jgi:SAM-dependent methyltransferase
MVEDFYFDVVRKCLRRGLLAAEDKILVVCGGPTDEEVLRNAQFANFTLSNIDNGNSGDVENLPYDAESFDAVIVHSGLHHCASPHRGLLEMYRVAKRVVILFEPVDSLATKAGRLVGLGQTYEFASVFDCNLKSGGWRNTSIPNWVYRFRPDEIRQTVCCNAPFGPHRIEFYYRTRIPWRQLKTRRNKLFLCCAVLLAPLMRLLDFVGPVFSNNMACVITKPRLPDEGFKWLKQDKSSWSADPAWFQDRFGKIS